MKPRAAIEESGARARAILEESGFQTELPATEVEESSDWLFSLPPGIGTLLNALLIAAAIVIVILLALALVRTIADRGRRGRDPGGGSPLTDALPEWARQATGDPEDLAAAGKYDAAIHALLLRALQRRVERAQRSFSDALTSRELVRGLAVDGSVRGALDELIASVERGWFGGFAVGADDYARCRRAYAIAIEEEA